MLLSVIAIDIISFWNRESAEVLCFLRMSWPNTRNGLRNIRRNNDPPDCVNLF